MGVVTNKVNEEEGREMLKRPLFLREKVEGMICFINVLGSLNLVKIICLEKLKARNGVQQHYWATVE